ncbi:EAL domain-containing protein [Bacillus sp. YZJH907-2]|uniref:EAL domain-containing protein n=1 Tax=Halalkalibacter suaedae TaxID=2822140 RepID=A0A941ANX6_9BACI|nr:EAL domain-containing protein [Bacillus suaedae]
MPIVLKNGMIFGTLCVLKQETFPFSSDDIETITNMASFLGYLIDLEYTSIHDVATGLYNNAFTSTYIGELVKEERSSFSVIYFDLDQFKYINDTLGYSVGNQLLATIGEHIKKEIGEDGVIARYGGDEFVLVLPFERASKNLEISLASLMNRFTKPFHVNGQALFTKASIGISFYPDDGSDFNDLIKHAEIAMYEAKANGRNNYQYFNQNMNVEVNRKCALTNDLSRAVEDKALEVYYQPQFNMQKKFIGMEALVRWNDPINGPIPPAEFIPMAEENGLILEIGQFVLETACRDVKELMNRGITDVKVAVNLSVRQFEENHLVEKVKKILEVTNLAPSMLTLEITENIAILDIADTISILEQMKSLGVQIAIDDFGTGYSSLSYLRTLPMDSVKLDRSFTTDLTADKKQATIVGAVIMMAHALELQVVGEGIETNEQMRFLEELGCDEFQGFLLGRPMPFADILELANQQ